MHPDDTNVPMVEGWIGPMNTIQRLAEIERARSERIARSASHEPRQIRLPVDHFRRRKPIRPFRHSADPLGTVPGESVAADTDAVTQGFSTTEDQIEIRVAGIDNDRAGRFLWTESTICFFRFWRQLLGLTGFRLIVGWRDMKRCRDLTDWVAQLGRRAYGPGGRMSRIVHAARWRALHWRLLRLLLIRLPAVPEI